MTKIWSNVQNFTLAPIHTSFEFIVSYFSVVVSTYKCHTQKFSPDLNVPHASPNTDDISF